MRYEYLIFSIENLKEKAYNVVVFKRSLSLQMKKEFNKKAHQLLRIKELNGHSVHIVEPDNPKSLALLTKSYKEVYEAAFPIEEERESLDAWLKSLKGENPNVNITISILGEDLDKPKPVLKAMSIGYYYHDQNVGLLGYLVTAPEFRGHGLGRTLNEANNHALMQSADNIDKKLGGIFLECNDPAKISPEEDVMDPAKRIDIYKKWGAIVLPVDYVQPPLTRESRKCDSLKLLAYPHPETGEYPTPDEIKAFINGIYSELAKHNGSTPQKDPDYIKIMAQIDAMSQKKPKPKEPSP